MKKAFAFGKDIYQVWITERPTQMAAAMAYYGMFSFVPVVYVAFLMVDFIGSRLNFPGLELDELISSLNPEIAQVLTDALSTISEPSSSGTIFGAIIGFGALLFAASGLFFQMQMALNTIWQVPPPVKGGTKMYILQRLISLLMVLGIGVLLILVLFLNIVVTWFQSLLGFFWDEAGSYTVLNYLVSVAILFFTLVLIYKFIPNRKISWRVVLIGSAVTTVFILIAGVIVGFLLSNGGFSSGIKAAGSLAVILIGIYYIAQILLFGAVVSRVSERYLITGSAKEPQQVEAQQV